MTTSDPNQLKVVKEISRADILFCLAHDEATRQLYVGSSDAAVYAINLADEKAEPKKMVGHRGYVTGLVIADEFLISGAYDGKLIWWQKETGKQVRSVDAHQKWIRQLRISPDGKTLASVSDDMICRLWDARSGSLLMELAGHEKQTPQHFPSMLFTCQFSSDGKLLATADKVGHVVVWDVADGKQLATVEAPTMYTWDPKQRIHSIGGIRSLAFSADSKLLAIGGIGKISNIDHLGALARVEVFDWNQAKQTHEFPGDEYKGVVEHLQFHPQGQWLLAAGGDHGGFIKFLDLQEKKIIKQAKAPMHVHDLAVNSATDTIIAVGHKRIVIWELKAAEPDEKSAKE